MADLRYSHDGARMIGIDAVDIERLRGVMARTKGAEQRLFTPGEQSYCHSRVDPVLHFAGTLAVKEAVIKAASLGPLVAWGRRIEVHRNRSGAPRVRIDGLDHGRIDISISHDGPVAVAVAVAHGSPSRIPHPVATASGGLRPNRQLLSYLGGHLRMAGQGDETTCSIEGTDFP